MYTVSLARFEGPLDLLLHLIEKAEVDIKDIFVSEITAQYLEYMKGLDELEPDAASEFAAMAATLLFIKSRTLLPKPETAPQEEEEDPETALIRQIREYKLFKKASEELAARKREADRVFARLPEEFPKLPPKVELAGVSADALYEAFVSILLRADGEQPSGTFRSIDRDAYHVSEKLAYLESVLKARRSVRFSELFSADSPKLERIVTFMALLELLSEGAATAEQREPFGEIYIAAVARGGEGKA